MRSTTALTIFSFVLLLSCSNRELDHVDHCELHGYELSKLSAYMYSGLPAPSYTEDIERFMMVGDTSKAKHYRHRWYSDQPGKIGPYRKVKYTHCETCQMIYDAEYNRVSELTGSEFQVEFSMKMKDAFSEAEIIPQPYIDIMVEQDRMRR